MEGTQASPIISQNGRAKMPKGLHRPQTIKWFCQEVELLITQYKCVKVCIKKTEAMAAKGNAFEIRVEHEATAYIAAANHGIKAVYKKVNATIAKDLGLKGRPKYLKTGLDTSPISNFDQRKTNEKDAILAAWSELP